MADRFKILGVNDDRDSCECCGRTGLKRVVWIEDTETGTIRHFGTTCATKPEKGFDTKAIKRAIRDYQDRELNAWNYAHRKYRAAGGEYAGNLSDGMTAVDLERLMLFYDEYRHEFWNSPGFLPTEETTP